MLTVDQQERQAGVETIRLQSYESKHHGGPELAAFDNKVGAVNGRRCSK
jgi:hypothetical protein